MFDTPPRYFPIPNAMAPFRRRANVAIIARLIFLAQGVPIFCLANHPQPVKTEQDSRDSHAPSIQAPPAFAYFEISYVALPRLAPLLFALPWHPRCMPATRPSPRRKKTGRSSSRRSRKNSSRSPQARASTPNPSSWAPTRPAIRAKSPRARLLSRLPSPWPATR